ncbi:MAG: PAS domain S-box protein, partial [Betaproteobacteria bacterium]|nr:PAS domain S-box protein [Betaproteobacteria bacterium]
MLWLTGLLVASTLVLAACLLHHHAGAAKAAQGANGAVNSYSHMALPLLGLLLLGVGTLTAHKIIKRATAHEAWLNSADAELHLRTTQLALLFDQNGIGMAEYGLDGRLIRANQALTERLGYEPGGLVGLKTPDFTHADDIDQDIAIFMKMQVGETSSHRVEKRYLHRNGKPVWVQVTGGALRDAHGAILGFQTMIEFIDERKQATEARDRAQQGHIAQMQAASSVLQFHQARLAAILDTAADVIITLDHTGTISMANRATAELLDVPPGQLTGTPITRWLPPEHRSHVPGILKQLDAARGTGASAPQWNPITLQDAHGRKIVVEAAFSSTNVNGQLFYVGVMRDMREIRAAQKALQQNRAMLAASLDSMSDGLLIVNAKRQIVHVNGSMVKFHCFNDSANCETLFKNYSNHFELTSMNGVPIAPADLPLARALRGEVCRHSEIRFHHHASGRRWVGSVSFSPVRDTSGAITGAVLTVRDTTEMHAMQERVARSEARMRALFESSADAILVADSELQVVAANAAATGLLGTRARPLAGQSLQALSPRRKRNAPLPIVDLLTHEGGTTQGHRQNLTLRSLRGREFPCDVSWATVDLESERLHCIIVRDVTERERTARELHRTRDELAAANEQLHGLLDAQQHVEEQERKRIARELHDDLQQRLAVIRMNQELLTSMAQTASSENMLPVLRQTATMVNETIDSLRRIVNDLRPQTLDLLGLPDALDLLVRGFNQLTGIEVDLEVIPAREGAAPLPDATVTHLYRTVQEALNNVRKHSGASFVFVCLDLSAPDTLELTIDDDGCGFRRHTLNRHGTNGLTGMTERARAL